MSDTDSTQQSGAAEAFEQNKRLFMRMMNHNLRSPLASMLSVIRVLESGAVTDPADIANLVKNASARGDDMMRMLDDMMLLFQVGEPDEAPPETFDPAAAARDATNHFNPAADAKQLTITVSAPEPPLSLTLNRKNFYILLRQLIDNAVRYSDPGTEIGIAFERRGGALAIAVSDRGLLIEPEDIAGNLYVAFWRSGAAKQFAGAGTGLGLAIAKTILAKWDGDISAASDAADGTVFTVLIPDAED